MEEEFKIYYELPKSVLKIMNWLCNTRFYNKTFLERKEYFEYVKEDWKFCDFEVLHGTLKNPKIIKIGEIPKYKGEHEKAIIINFDKPEECYLVRGYAVGLWANNIIENKYDIPNYMKKDLYNYINEFRTEENIKKLRESIIEEKYHIYNKDLKNTLEHILSDYKRVLKENEELKKFIIEGITIEPNSPYKNYQLDFLRKNFIPRQNIKDKIEFLKKEGYWLFITDRDSDKCVEVLQELLDNKIRESNSTKK